MAQPDREFDSASFEEIQADLDAASQRLREFQENSRQAKLSNEAWKPARDSAETETSEIREKSESKIHVVDLDIPFTSLIWLFGKAALAAIPAGILLAFLWTGISTQLPEIFALIWAW